jgi:hypothetical protein
MQFWIITATSTFSVHVICNLYPAHLMLPDFISLDSTGYEPPHTILPLFCFDVDILTSMWI